MTGYAWGLLAWWRHPSVAPVVRSLDLGSSERDGTQRLILKRPERQVFVATTEEARRIVRDQWPVEQEIELTPEQWREVVEEVRQRMLDRPLPSIEQLVTRMNAQSQTVSALVRWLDADPAGE